MLSQLSPEALDHLQRTFRRQGEKGVDGQFFQQSLRLIPKPQK